MKHLGTHRGCRYSLNRHGPRSSLMPCTVVMETSEEPGDPWTRFLPFKAGRDWYMDEAQEATITTRWLGCTSTTWSSFLRKTQHSQLFIAWRYKNTSTGVLDGGSRNRIVLRVSYEGTRNTTRISIEKEENRAIRRLPSRPFPLDCWVDLSWDIKNETWVHFFQ
jgi:hypothetical protein